MSGKSDAGQGSGERFQFSDEVVQALSRPTISVEDAGRLFFDMKSEPARAAARKGEIPSIKIGRKLLVPTWKLREMLGLSEPQKAA